MTKTIVSIIYKNYRNLKWKIQANSCRKHIQSIEGMEMLKGKLLILMPHSDDEWIGCGHLLTSRTRDVVVVNMDMSGDDSLEVHAIREKEANNASKKIGFLEEKIQNKESDLEKLMLKYEPEIVLLPSMIDWHEEHREVMRIFQRVSDRIDFNGKAAMYQVSLPIPSKWVNFVLPMSKKEWMTKWKFLKDNYVSQSFLPIKRFALNEYIAGKYSGTYAGESYAVLGYQEWKILFNGYQLNGEQKEKLHSCVNQLIEIRHSVEALAKKLSEGKMI